jgi:hypothetical protein
VQAHLAACDACRTLAGEYATQEARIASLPHPALSPARQQTVLAQVRREAGWLRWRLRASNALGAAAAVLLGPFVAGGTILYASRLSWMLSSVLLDWLANLLLIPLLPAVGAVSAVYGWSTRRAARRLPPASLLAATILLLGLAALLTPWLLTSGNLPESGAPMPWISSDTRVPAGGWTLFLPIARVLAAVAPWAVLLTVVLQAGRLASSLASAPPIPFRTRRHLWLLALAYGGLLLAAVAADAATGMHQGLGLEGIVGRRLALVLGAAVSWAAAMGLSAWLSRRRGPGRWAGLACVLALAGQIAAWLLGLGRLNPLGAPDTLLGLLQGLPVPSVGSVLVPLLAALAVAVLAWHLAVAVRALVDAAEGRVCDR